METAIITKPIHHGNTKEIPEVLANSLEVELFALKDFNPYTMKGYDIKGLC
jgi:flavodoxin